MKSEVFSSILVLKGILRSLEMSLSPFHEKLYKSVVWKALIPTNGLDATENPAKEFRR